MKRAVLAVSLLLSLLFSGFSQAGYLPGFIITHEKDTLYGKVAYVDLTLLRMGCQFIQEGESVPMKYSPADLYGFGFIGDMFLVSRDVSVYTPAHVRRSPNGDIQVPESTVEEKVFLEVLVEGAANLYKYNQQVFFAEKGGDLYQLYSEVREVDFTDLTRKGQILTKELKRFVGVLHIVMNDCPGIAEQINAVNLDEGPLTRLFIEYSKCRDIQHRFFKEGRGNISLSFALKGGVQGSYFSFTPTYRYSQIFDRGIFGFPVTPHIFAQMSFSNKRLSENTSLEVGLFWNYHNLSDSLTFSEGVFDHSHNVELKYHEIGIPLGVSYSFNRTALKPYLAGGLMFVFNVGEDFFWYWQQASSSVTVVRVTPDSFIKPSQFGGYFGGGLEWPVFKKSSIITELKFHFTDGLANLDSSYGYIIDRAGKLSGHILVGLKF